jgi:hypothetical protein
MLIYNVLIVAGCVREGPPQGIPIGAMQSILLLLVDVGEQADDQTKNAAKTLVSVLNNEGIAAKLGTDTVKEHVVDIMIGLKP